MPRGNIKGEVSIVRRRDLSLSVFPPSVLEEHINHTVISKVILGEFQFYLNIVQSIYAKEEADVKAAVVGL